MEPIDEQKDIENKRLQPSVRSGIGYTLLLSSMDTHFDPRPLSTLFFSRFKNVYPLLLIISPSLYDNKRFFFCRRWRLNFFFKEKFSRGKGKKPHYQAAIKPHVIYVNSDTVEFYRRLPIRNSAGFDFCVRDKKKAL